MATSPQTATASLASAPVAAAPRSRKLLIGALIAVGLVAVAAIGYIALGRLKPATGAHAAAAEVEPEKPIFVTLEPLTVNLQAEGKPRFLHIGIALRVRDAKSQAQLVEFMPELRGRLLMLLSNRQPDTLQSSEDKSKLADEILAELNRPLGDKQQPQGVTGVSFNTFVVQ